MTQLQLDLPPIQTPQNPKKRKKTKHSDYQVHRFDIRAHRDVLMQWPTIRTDLDAFLTSWLEDWAKENDLVLTERRSGKEREVTAEPRSLVNRRAGDARRLEEVAESRRRRRETFDRASRALATPGD